jgi:hypothetical protein
MSVGGDVATSSPFSVPFNVKNVSWLFAMSDAQMNCGLDKVVLVSPMQFTSTNVFLVSPQVMIKPGKEGAFRCAIGGEQYNLLRVTPFSLKSVHIFLSMHYWILWLIPRKTESVEFNLVYRSLAASLDSGSNRELTQRGVTEPASGLFCGQPAGARSHLTLTRRCALGPAGA